MATTHKIMAVQGAAVLVAAAFLIVGVLGFIPGVTTDYASQWAGHHSGAKLFGISPYRTAQRRPPGVRRHRVSRWRGLMLTHAPSFSLAGSPTSPVGVRTPHRHGQPAGVVPANNADSWLHFGLGVGMLLAATLAGQHDPTKRRAKARPRR
jgi:hypothetical protein